MYMAMFVLNDSKKIDQILDGWSQVGVNGATLLESTGAYRRRMRIPGRYAYATTSKDETNTTLMAIVEKEDTINKCLEMTEKIIGNLDEPNTGVFSYWPLAYVKGISKNYHQE